MAGLVGDLPHVRREQIHRDRQMHRAFAAGVGHHIRPLQIERDLRGARRFGSPFHDRPRHSHLVDILECLPMRHGAGPAATHCDQRAPGQIRRGNSRKRIGMTWTAGHQRKSRFAVDPRPGVRGMRHGRFMPHVHNTNPAARGLQQDFVQVIAHQSEDRVDPKLGDRLHEQLGSIWHRIAMLLQSDW